MQLYGGMRFAKVSPLGLVLVRASAQAALSERTGILGEGHHHIVPRLPGADPLILGLSRQEAAFLGLFVIAGLGLAHLCYNHKRDALATACPFWRTFRSMLVTLTACCIFMIVGPALIMLNKHLMDELHFNYPISICSMGLVCSSVLSHLVVHLRLGEVREESLKVVSGSAWFRIAAPIGLMKALTMALGNAAYLHLSLGFIQMLKAFTPLIVLIVMHLAGVKLPTRAAMWCVTGIIAGTLVQVNGELHATAYGMFLMISSETFEAVSVVLSQKILQNYKFTVLEGMYITAPAGSICLLVGVLILEVPEMLHTGGHLIPMKHPWTFALAAALGVAINFVSFLVMRLTSALTMKILNTARSVGLVVIGILFYAEVHPPVQLMGYALALVGFSGYNFFQLYSDAARSVENQVDSAVNNACTCCPRLKPPTTRSPASSDCSPGHRTRDADINDPEHQALAAVEGGTSTKVLKDILAKERP